MRRPPWEHLVVPALLLLAAVCLWAAYDRGAPSDPIRPAQHGPARQADPR